MVILSEDGRRRSWTVWVNSTSSAGVRLALGRHARENADNSSTSVPVAAGEVLDGHSAATIAVVTDTPGTQATVHLVAELDGIN